MIWPTIMVCRHHDVAHQYGMPASWYDPPLRYVGNMIWPNITVRRHHMIHHYGMKASCYDPPLRYGDIMIRSTITVRSIMICPTITVRRHRDKVHYDGISGSWYDPSLLNGVKIYYKVTSMQEVSNNMHFETYFFGGKLDSSIPNGKVN